MGADLPLSSLLSYWKTHWVKGKPFPWKPIRLAQNHSPTHSMIPLRGRVKVLDRGPILWSSYWWNFTALTAGKHVALLGCLSFCLCVEMKLLQADGSPDWIQYHRTLVDCDFARAADGVGGRTSNSLVVRKNIVRVKLEVTNWFSWGITK